MSSLYRKKLTRSLSFILEPYICLILNNQGFSKTKEKKNKKVTNNTG